MIAAWYNEIDAKAAAWLGYLQQASLIPSGPIDTRSIADVQPDDLVGHGTCHFFAGIGGWPLALEMAGWPASRPVWTGSCPCQPFSCAGKGKAEKDSRHLWPEFRRLIAEFRPATVFGEQVASKLGRGWLAGVRADMEALGYAFGSADLCAAGTGAPHIRQRLFWVGNTPERGLGADGGAPGSGRHADQSATFAGGRGPPLRTGLEGRGLSGCGRGDQRPAGQAVHDSRMADTERDGRRIDEPQRGPQGRVAAGGIGAWDDFRVVACRDGKHRRMPAEPAFFPLAHGLPGRVAQLRGLGNAICPQIAAEFIRAFLETEGEP